MNKKYLDPARLREDSDETLRRRSLNEIIDSLPEDQQNTINNRYKELRDNYEQQLLGKRRLNFFKKRFRDVGIKGMTPMEFNILTTKEVCEMKSKYTFTYVDETIGQERCVHYECSDKEYLNDILDHLSYFLRGVGFVFDGELRPTGNE